jgi:hypothetical protein
MPPRIVQPSRLQFGFVPAATSSADPTNPICGWLYHHPLDQALAVCAQDGRLLGEVSITHEVGGVRSVRWESLASPRPVTAEEIPDPDLSAFVLGLLEESVTEGTKLESLLALIQEMLKPRPGTGTAWGGGLLEQPLALVKAQVGLELFGRPWQDWRLGAQQHKAQSTGAFVETYRAPVLLGDPDGGQDGLIGYYRAPAFDRIVPAPTSRSKRGGYLADPQQDAPQAGFGTQVPLTLLMDPRGSVLASSGLLPAQPLTLAPEHVEAGTSRLEVSFRVGPLLTRPGVGAIPVPASPDSAWFFQGPGPEARPLPLVPFDASPRFDPLPCVVKEGRLIRRQLEHSPTPPSTVKE